MKIIVAIDSFKGSLTSLEAGKAAEIGIKKAAPAAEVKIYPLADGGEGTCKTLTEGLGGKIKSVKISGALGKRIAAEFGEIGDLAIIEMASAAGLSQVPTNLRNPLRTTTFGVGEMILHAVKDGCRNFIIGIGGSATNDCGLGMLTALGFNFGSGIFGRDLARARKIESDKVPAEIFDCKFRIACDVKNPLTGENGCSAVYGPQKGADEKIVAQMDDWIKNFAEMTLQTLNIEKKSVEGDGAAGGLGFAFRTFLRGELVPGVDLVLDTLKISDDLRDADILITGEGSIDNQTLQGKAPAGVAKLAKSLNPKIKVVAIGGSVKNFSSSEIDAAFSILREPMTLESAMQKSTAEQNISATVENLIRIL
ncbi:MAG: glycerate kinase [Selenomonadaceae bacterium]|nr:glycerate kinase [Selenomonadaceae bacterium]